MLDQSSHRTPLTAAEPLCFKPDVDRDQLGTQSLLQNEDCCQQSTSQ
jgi:hypothetical protein